MDQPPGSLDELQPQDLSTCSIPSVVDLTRIGEATSLEAMRMGKSPRWYPNSGNGRTGLPLAEAASSDIGVQSGEQIQSDTAFSNTTVTLSYVSRSHVFSSQDSLSAHSSLYAVPSIAKFSLQSSCESENGLGEAGYPLSQHYLQHSDRPLDLATPTQLFQALAQAQVRDEGDQSQLCLTQPGSHRLNGGLLCGEGQADASLQGAFESGLPRETESSLSLENGGQCHDWPASGHSSPNTIEPRGSGNLRSNEPVPVPGTQEPSVVGEGAGGGEVPSAGKGHSSSLEDHASSTSATSPGQASVPGARAARPPGAAHTCTEEADEVIWDGLDTGNPIEPSPSEQARRSGDGGASPPTEELTNHGALPTELASAGSPPPNAKDETAAVPHVNGNATTLPGSSPPRRKLPARLGRGTRLEALVLNICPSAYKDATPAGRTAPKAPRKAAAPSHPPGSPPPGKEDGSAGGPEKASVSAARAANAGTSERVAAADCKDSTSDCERFSNSKNLHNGTPSHAAAPRFPARGKPEWAPPVPPRVTYPAAAPAELEPGEIDFPYTLPEDQPQAGTPAKSPKKSPSGTKAAASGVRGSPPAKAARPPRRRRKVAPGGHASSMFSPAEPEIKLKYVTYKEERRDPRLDSFSPLVRVRPRPPAPCLYTVINYAEEDSTRQAGRPHGSPGGFLSGTTPGTSCLRPGRVSAHGQHRRSLVCCLCGASANATGLGDLHGPYYPEGYRPAGKTKASASGPETGAAEAEEGEEEEEEEGGDEEDSSDSDSSASSCSMRGAGGRRRARPPPGSWPRPGPPGSPAAKQARMEAGGGGGGGGGLQAVDWYSPPVVAQEPAEYWLHEDCSVWAAGVFLVKGKVYGLEEAVKVAQATMCSGCRSPGATLGCLFKGCPNKYHYRCAVESDCVLVEENFSMRCKKHKNKSPNAPGGNRRDGR